MRAMNPHVRSDGYVSYCECADCVWVYRFPRSVKESDLGLTYRQMAQRDFDAHVCERYPGKPPLRSAGSINGSTDITRSRVVS
jgi:hypothetical protein